MLLLILSASVQSQVTIKGRISNSVGDAIASANIVCKSGDSSIAAFSYTDAEGHFKLYLEQPGEFLLEFSSLGFEKLRKDLVITEDSEKNIYLKIELQKKVVQLKEVILVENKPIVVKKDTIVFNAKAFSRGDEEVVEDLLKNLPNISVEDGVIRVGNTEIEKIMIEGDDFFNRAYRMISKNMPSRAIAEVELINKYSEKKLLRHLVGSDKIALNLRLKESAKRIWFGNTALTHGIVDNNYALSIIAMNFGKKSKYYAYSNLNNIGQDAKGDIQGLLSRYTSEGHSTTGNKEAAFQLLNLEPIPLNFKRERSNFNNSELVSFNTIGKPAQDIKITANGFINWDENGFFQSDYTVVAIPGLSFNNDENREMLRKQRLGFIAFDMDLSLSKSALFNSSTHFKTIENIGRSSLSFNTNESFERLNSIQNNIVQTFTYTKKIDEKSALVLSSKYIYDEIPQRYVLKGQYYPKLFPGINNVDTVVQNSKSSMRYININAQLLSKMKGGHIFNIQLGGYKQVSDFKAVMALDKEDGTLLQDGFQNDLAYATTDLYLKTKYSWQGKHLGLTSSLELHQLRNTITDGPLLKGETAFYLNPRIGFDWSINDKNRLKTTFAINTINADISEVYSNFSLRGARWFYKGTGAFNQWATSNVLLNYNLGNWSDKTFVSAVVYYQWYHRYFSNNSIIEPGYTLTERLLLKGKWLLNYNIKIDTYIPPLLSNLKLDLGFSSLNYQNVVNSTGLREVRSDSYNYGLQFRTGFSGSFNFHTGTKWSSNKIIAGRRDSYTNNLSFIDMAYNPGENFNLQMEAERYFFGKLDTKSNTYYFLDFRLLYKWQENKMEFGLIGKNLFNTKTYRSYAISDVGRSISEFRLLPRFLLLKFKFRF